MVGKLGVKSGGACERGERDERLECPCSWSAGGRGAQHEKLAAMMEIRITTFFLPGPAGGSVRLSFSLLLMNFDFKCFCIDVLPARRWTGRFPCNLL